MLVEVIYVLAGMVAFVIAPWVITIGIFLLVDLVRRLLAGSNGDTNV